VARLRQTLGGRAGGPLTHRSYTTPQDTTVASYADPYGNEKANTDFTRLRAQVVIDGLVANGVMASRIQRREIGSVKFQSDPQESRRVEIIVGKP
jgi:outer membrane protein OmpA-like peptidoglycan-associated protein